jgi:pyruvate dehydrogenase E2 component (dihydrolipoamide acetyltransferase)
VQRNQLTQVKGSGENGRIVKSDVENFTPAAAVPPAPAPVETCESTGYTGTRSEGLFLQEKY